MLIDSEENLLHQLLNKVEIHLGWGPGKEWTTQDFTDLSKKIFETTGVVLSITTLKRLWGKVNYKSKPTAATLNALAQFVGYENWQSFRQNVHQNLIDISLLDDKKNQPVGKKKKTILLLVLLLPLLIITVFFIKNNSTESNDEVSKGPKNNFSFSSKMMVSEGVPNSVIFNYDATAAHPRDTVYIQQSWDERLREKVSFREKNHRSIYYHPGFFQAKLVINASVVKEHPLLIKTKGWLPLVEHEPVPIYFDAKDAENSGILNLSKEKLEEKNIPLQPLTPWISFYNVRKFPDLKTDNFIFKTSIKNDYNEGAAACQHAEIHILFEGGVFNIPLSLNGCVSALTLYDVNGKIKDTSALGCDLSKWVEVQLVVKNKVGHLYINNKLAYDNLNYDFPSAEIIGLRFRFQGTGSVKTASFLRENGEVLYAANFKN